MSEEKKQPEGGWGKLWQVPLLLIGVGLFLFGLKAIQPPLVPFKDHVETIERLLGKKDYVGAVKEVNRIQNYYMERAQQAQIEVLLGDAFFGAQMEVSGGEAGGEQEKPKLSVDGKKNLEQVLAHYGKAIALGFVPTEQFNERWGLAALELGQIKQGIEKLEPLVKEHPLTNIELSKALVEGYLTGPTTAEPENVVKPEPALEILKALSKAKKLDDRVWALMIRLELTEGRTDNGEVLAEAAAEVATIQEHKPKGMLQTVLGEALYNAGRLDEAEAQLLSAKKQYVVIPRLEDGKAELILGRIAQARAMSLGEKSPQRKELLAKAEERYQNVLTHHAGSIYMTAALFGRAEVAAYGHHPDDHMLSDYEAVIKKFTGAEEHKPAMLSEETVREALIHQHGIYLAGQEYRVALKLLNLAHKLKDNDKVGMTLRDAVTQEALANELAKSYNLMGENQEGRKQLREETLKYLQQAGEAYYHHSHLSAMQDEVARASLWKSAQLFDRAGMARRSLQAYNEFVKQWPKESRVPEALYTAGLLHESLGEFEDAIAVYRRNIQENPKTPATYLSTLQLACSYMAQGQEQFGKAEETLLSLVNDNRELQPTANEFRVAIFKLGDLYYRTGRWSDAILRMEEACTRYPNDPQVPRVTYYLADSYRKSAMELAGVLKKEPQNAQRDQLENERQSRLKRAGVLFDKVIKILDPDTDVKPQLGPVETEYLRNCYLYRADCQFDLGQYPAAIKLYELTASRFTGTMSALQAYVQVVNGYVAMRETSQAKAAAERARWMLQRIPDEAFAQATPALPRKYYADLLDMRRFGP